MFQTLTYSLLTALQQWRIVAIIYFFQFCLALSLGLEVQNVLKASIGNSLSINNLVQNYDHTVISDFLQVHGASIIPLIGQLRWLILLYLVLAVFIDAGLLLCAEKGKQATLSDFFQNGLNYFLSFLKIFIFFLFFALLWIGIILAPSVSYLMTALELYPNESYTIWTLLSLIFLCLIGLSFLLIWSILSRFVMIKQGKGIFFSIKKGWQIFYQDKIKYYTLFLFFLSLQIIFLILYGYISETIGMTTMAGIFVVFFLQQLFIFSRILLKQALYIGINQLCVTDLT